MAGKEICVREQLLLSSASFSWSLWAQSEVLLAFKVIWFCTWPACPLFCTLFYDFLTKENRLWSDLESVLCEKLFEFPTSLEFYGWHGVQTDSFFDKRVVRLSLVFELRVSKDGVFALYFSAWFDGYWILLPRQLAIRFPAERGTTGQFEASWGSITANCSERYMILG